MVKNIETLVTDIYEFLDGRSPFDDSLRDEFASSMHDLLGNRLGPQAEYEPSLRMSNLGKPCERQVWLGIHRAGELEDLPPYVRLKFLYGDVIEELLLFLAKASGHRVEGCQDELELEGVIGHRDAVIDGVLVDVKSASSYSFQKFSNGDLASNDPFGYIGQLQTYLEASQDDVLVTDKSRCAFLVMDKTLGHVCLDIHSKVDFDVREITRRKVKIMYSDEMPDRAFNPEPDGQSGNMKLPMQCSYCNAKHACHSGIRTFLYSGGPRYLTTVKKLPKNTKGPILEVTNV